MDKMWNAWIETLRDLIGQLSARLGKKDYQRFSLGQKVRWLDTQTGLWDTGEITAARVAGFYSVRDAEYNDHLLEWENIRPIK